MISKELLKEIISSNQEFILNKIKTIIKRENISLPKELNKVAIIYGVRRSGKSFLLYDLYRNTNGRVLYVDFEDERLTDFTVQDFEILKEAFLEISPETNESKIIFLFDEIQNVKGWEKFVRRISEKEDIKVIVTGSSSKFMPTKINTALRGRIWSIKINPFSFREHLLANNVKFSTVSAYGSKKIILKKYFTQYFQWGGFPEVVLCKDEFEKRKMLREYLNSIFFKDLVEKYKMDNLTLLDVLMDKLLSSFSMKVSLNAFYKQYKGKFPFSKDSLFNYYKYFLESMIIFEVKKFSESAYTRMRNPGKVYLIDTGLAKHITSSDWGRLLENIVAEELNKKYEKLFYFEEENECDFIAGNENDFNAYQVCYELNPQNMEREISGIMSACKYLKLKKGTILTNDQEDEIKKENIQIKILPVWKWLISGSYKVL